MTPVHALLVSCLVTGAAGATGVAPPSGPLPASGELLAAVRLGSPEPGVVRIEVGAACPGGPPAHRFTLREARGGVARAAWWEAARVAWAPGEVTVRDGHDRVAWLSLGEASPASDVFGAWAGASLVHERLACRDGGRDPVAVACAVECPAGSCAVARCDGGEASCSCDPAPRCGCGELQACCPESACRAGAAPAAGD